MLLDMADAMPETTMNRAGSGAPSSLVDLTADALGAVFRSLSSTDLAHMPYVCRHLRDAMIVTGEILGHKTQSFAARQRAASHLLALQARYTTLCHWTSAKQQEQTTRTQSLP